MQLLAFLHALVLPGPTYGLTSLPQPCSFSRIQPFCIMTVLDTKLVFVLMCLTCVYLPNNETDRELRTIVKKCRAVS